ncbi:MAG: hypothetical protein K5773_07515 [Pseudobutyrivibrio sp.]|nr:hypothetical protein [Pseudobutyrivibrio sp.]
MAISPIMGLSSYGSVSSVQPMNYAVENTAGFSDVYQAESTKNSAGVNSTTPVRYPDAQINEIEVGPKVDEGARLAKNQEVNSSFNQIAEKFSAVKTGYTKDAQGLSYGQLGGGIDIYA